MTVPTRGARGQCRARASGAIEAPRTLEVGIRLGAVAEVARWTCRASRESRVWRIRAFVARLRIYCALAAIVAYRAQSVVVGTRFIQAKWRRRLGTVRGILAEIPSLAQCVRGCEPSVVAGIAWVARRASSGVLRRRIVRPERARFRVACAFEAEVPRRAGTPVVATVVEIADERRVDFDERDIRGSPGVVVRLVYLQIEAVLPFLVVGARCAIEPRCAAPRRLGERIVFAEVAY